MSTSHAANGITSTNITNWNTAYGWGDHATAGYLTSFTETDPVVKAINGIVKSNGTTISAAVSGTDYLTPNGSAASLTSFPTLNQNTTGTAANVTGTVGVANGGTGATTKTAAFNALSPMSSQGDIIYGGASGAGTSLPAGTAGQVLTMNAAATAPVWASTATNQVDNLNPASITNNVGPRLLQLNGALGGVKITPSKSGKILIILTGDAVLTGFGTTAMYAQLYYNTSVASGFGVVTTGFTSLGSETVVAVNTQKRAFSLSSVLPTLTIGTTYYFDLGIYSDANTATVFNISVTIVEL